MITKITEAMLEVADEVFAASEEDNRPRIECIEAAIRAALEVREAESDDWGNGYLRRVAS